MVAASSHIANKYNMAYRRALLAARNLVPHGQIDHTVEALKNKLEECMRSMKFWQDRCTHRNLGKVE